MLAELCCFWQYIWLCGHTALSLCFPWCYINAFNKIKVHVLSWNISLVDATGCHTLASS